MTPARAIAGRHRTGLPPAVWLLIAAGVPVLGAVAVVGIYLDHEVIVAAAWVAFAVAACVFVQPVVGVIAMTAGFLLAAYPTVLQDLGVLTINNLLGLCLSVALVAYVVTERDLSFLTRRQVLILAGLGILLLLSTAHAAAIFPNMKPSQGLGIKGKELDRTSDMMHDFFARLIFLSFLCAFVRSRRDIGALFWTFVLVLFLAVPSALINWWQGTLSHGFRAMASVTAGANANRLAMICLMEVACWWYWLRVRPDGRRWTIGGGAIAGGLLVVLATGSRSGLLGCVLFAILLQSGPRFFRAAPVHIGLAIAASVLAIAFVVPPEAWERMLVISTSNSHDVDSLAAKGAASSLALREDTIETGFRMFKDHPFLGVGLGNYREVSRQIYLDQFFRPPHNSVMWAASEGGLFVLAGYVLLFWVTWRELMLINRLALRDPTILYMVGALRIVFLLYCFFAVLADLCLNPITYVLIGLVITMRRYLEQLPERATPAARLAVAG